MENYTIEQLNKKSHIEVRDIARTVGIPAPTKINKGELIDMIIKITNREIDAPERPKRGRPPKEAYNKEEVDNIVEELDKEEEPTDDEILTNDGPIRINRYDTKPSFRTIKRGGGYAPTLNEVSSEQERSGFLEINPDGYGFLRVKNGEINDLDAYVPAPKIKQYGLRRGDFVYANCKTMQEGKPPAVVNVMSINGCDIALIGRRPNFDELVAIYPDERLRLEVSNKPREYATRCIDLVAPIGKGQRGIIVSPPKAGKTTMLKMIANAISENYPEVVLLVLLIDERPEEVTDMQRSIRGEVIYSTFDELPEHHTKTAEMLLERAKRMVETGKDVVILMDSLTRLARAYNLTNPPTGRTLSGGIDPGALHPPKRFFGSARKIENGGSLTIIATALIDTGSRMDEVIFEEFKGTGNMEIYLDRKLQEKRVFPAIDLAKSGTRREELLLSPTELEGTWAVRKLLSSGDTIEATENLLNMLVKTASNAEFVEQVNMQLIKWQKDGFPHRRPNN